MRRVYGALLVAMLVVCYFYHGLMGSEIGISLAMRSGGRGGPCGPVRNMMHRKLLSRKLEMLLANLEFRYRSKYP